MSETTSYHHCSSCHTESSSTYQTSISCNRQVMVNNVVGEFSSVSMACKMVPSVITYSSQLKTGRECYYSVNLSADGHVICGTMGKAEVWDADRSEIKHSTRVEGHMMDMNEYGDHLYRAWKYPNQLTVVRYDRQLTNREAIVSIPYKADPVSHIDVRYGSIAVTDYDNKLIKLYTTDGGFLRDIQLQDAQRPYGVHLMKDNCVLVYDFESNSLTKYRTDGSGDIVWRCDDRLLRPSGMCVNEWGLIFVCCINGEKIYLISPTGNCVISH